MFSTLFVQSTEGADAEPARPSWRVVGLEWLLITLAVLAFCRGFLDLGTQRALPGNEAEVFQALDWVLVNSLEDHGQFPLWNPYLHTGLPYVADPMLHAYNPFASVPVLLFGVLDGFKLAVFFSYLAAAFGMWWLALRLGVTSVGRLWMALMYAFTGAAVARFWQGQYLFIFSFAWIPWVLASLWAVLTTRRPRYAVAAVITSALLFFSGNIYYAYYMVFVVALLALVLVFDVRRRRPFVALHLERVALLVIIGLLLAGLVAVQLLPLAEFWPHITKPTNLSFSDSHSLSQIWLDYTSRETLRPDITPAVERHDFYAYIGIWPFLLLALLPLAAWRRARRPLLFFGLLLLFVIAWANVREMPWRSLFVQVRLLSQFRYPTRILVFGACALIVLAGLGLDSLWRLIWRGTRLRAISVPEVARLTGAWAAILAVGVFLVWSVADVYRTNSQYARTRDYYAPSYEIAAWLHQYDPSPTYVANPDNWHGSLVSNRLRYMDAWYHFADIRPITGLENRRVVQARPNYQVLGNDRNPDLPDPVAVQRFAQHTVYALPHSLPFAFAVTDAQLADGSSGRELWREDVIPLQPTMFGPSQIEVVAEGEAGMTLTVLTTAYRGWQVTVDGRPHALRNVGGYLATAMQPGGHKYVFSFRSVSFKIGLVISLLSLFCLIGLWAWDRWGWGPLARARRFKTDAIYVGGVLKPAAPLGLPEGAPVHLTVEPAEEATTSPEEVAPSAAVVPAGSTVQPAGVRPTRVRGTVKLEWALFGLALLIYVGTRLWAIDRFPIFFFADEATHAVYAQDLLDRGLKDAKGSVLPIYFEAAGNRWTPLLSVYVHAVSVALFGKSILVTRATGALVSVLAALTVALILKLVFRARFWWAGALLVAVAPAWFLHSRTGFETVMMSSFFACFLLCYLLYRTRSPRFLFAAILFGAATFYTYSNGQMIMAAAGLLLAIFDLPYHLRNWRTTLLGLLLFALLATPVFQFRASQPESMNTHLRALDSYWFRDKPLSEKLAQFADTYSNGLSPAYWFVPNEHDLARHRMKGYGNLSLPLLPFFLAGVGLCLWRIRSAPHRAVLLAMLATPAGAALVDVSITRVLAFIVPATLLIALGIEAGWERVRRWVPYALAAVLIFALLGGSSIWMLHDALVNGPLWYSDYGLYGMQYGAKQLFAEAVPDVLRSDPNVRIMMTSKWANGADTFIRFFLPAEQQARVQMLDVDYYMKARRSLGANTVLVTTPAEYEQARSSAKFQRVDVERVLPYPDGRPGFYFVRLEYAAEFDTILAQEREERSRPVVEQVTLDGQIVQLSHSIFDIGQSSDLFDGDPFTLARGLEANPLLFDFVFPEPRQINGLSATFGSMDFSLTVKLYTDGVSEPLIYEQTFRGLPPDPTVEMTFDRGPASVSRLHLEVLQLNAGTEVHIHVRELKLR